MKNYFSKSFISALMICSVVNTGLRANDAPVTVGYESSTPFVMPTYQPQQQIQPTGFPTNGAQSNTNDSQPNFAKAVLRGVIRGATLNNVLAGQIHKATNGSNTLNQQEEIVEAITVAVVRQIRNIAAKSASVSILEKAAKIHKKNGNSTNAKNATKQKEKTIYNNVFLTNPLGIITSIVKDAIDEYPTIEASQAERIAVFIAQFIASSINVNEILLRKESHLKANKQLVFNPVKGLLAVACNYWATRKADQKRDNNPDAAAWEIKQTWGYWRVLKFILT